MMLWREVFAFKTFEDCYLSPLRQEGAFEDRLFKVHNLTGLLQGKAVGLCVHLFLLLNERAT